MLLFAFFRACATQTDEFGCAACGNEQQLRNKAQKDREEAYYEVRRMRHLMYVVGICADAQRAFCVCGGHGAWTEIW